MKRDDSAAFDPQDQIRHGHPKMAQKHPSPIDQHVGSRVRMRRLMLNMNQTAIANELKITFQQIQKYESGMNRLSAGRLQDLAQFLLVPISFFFEHAPGAAGSTTHDPTPRYVRAFLASNDGLRLVRAFMRIESAGLRRRVVELVQQIAVDDPD